MNTQRQNRILICILSLILLVGMLNLFAISQTPTETEGFSFFRLPNIFGNYRQASVKYYKNRIIKWEMLATIPAGATDVYDGAGNNVVWDQARVDSIKAKIAEYYTRLGELGEGDWQYVP